MVENPERPSRTSIRAIIDVADGARGLSRGEVLARLVTARSVKPAPATSTCFSSPTLMETFNRQTQTRETNEDNEKLILEPLSEGGLMSRKSSR
jgi:hypothetical protein